MLHLLFLIHPYLRNPDGAKLALKMIDESLERLANRAEGEAEIRRRIGPQFSAANGDKK